MIYRSNLRRAIDALSTSLPVNRRILIIDDNRDIHRDFRKVIGGDTEDTVRLAAAELALLGEKPPAALNLGFEIDSAYQGQEGVARVQQALDEGRPYAMAFVDMRMPPGWDGLETIERLWAIDPDVQIVICSAHSDYDWTDVVARLNNSDKLLVVKKPFEAIEVMQCANALTRKWQNERIVRREVETLEQVVNARTQGLETANKQLRHLATHDALTGLPNRVLMDDRISQSIVLAERQAPDFRRHFAGPRSLQTGERFARSSRRRRTAQGGGAAAEKRRARHRYGCTPRRRRVRADRNAESRSAMRRGK